MAECIGLEAQIVQRADDAAGYVQEGEAAGLAAGIKQALGKLRADGVQDARALAGQGGGEQLVQALVAELGQLTRRARAQQHLADVGGHEQAHLADELAGVHVAQHQFAPVALDADDAQGAADDVVQGICGIARAEDIAARRMPAPVALVQEMAEGGVVKGQRTDDWPQVAEYAEQNSGSRWHHAATAPE